MKTEIEKSFDVLIPEASLFDSEAQQRMSTDPLHTTGAMGEYGKLINSASVGAVTDKANAAAKRPMPKAGDQG